LFAILTFEKVEKYPVLKLKFLYLQKLVAETTRGIKNKSFYSKYMDKIIAEF